MCEMIDPSTSRSARVAFVADIKIKADRENHKRGYESQIEDPYPVENFQRTRGPIQRNENNHSQVIVAETLNKMQEKYLQLHLITSLQIDRIPLF